MADREKLGIRAHRAASKNDKLGSELFGDLQ